MKNLITFLLFTLPFLGNAQVDCDKIFVRDIFIDPEEPEKVQIFIYNSNEEHINNTWIDRVVDENGDLIAGFGQFFYFYAHGESRYQTYPLPTDLSSIPSDLKATVYFKFSDFDSIIEHRTCDLSFPTPKLDSLKSRLKLYPNPTTGEFFLLFDNPNKEIYTLEIYDLFGKKVKENLQIDWEGYVFKRKLPAGIYIVHLKKGNKLLLNEKLVVQ